MTPFSANESTRISIITWVIILKENIGWGFCDIQNSQGRGKGYQPLTRPGLFWISQKPNLIIVLLYTERKNGSHVFATQSAQTWNDNPWPWESLTWWLYNLQLWRHGRWFWKFTVRFRPIRKELESLMYNNSQYLLRLLNGGVKCVVVNTPLITDFLDAQI